MNTRARIVALAQWSALGTCVGVLSGLASALFLWLLEEATQFRSTHERLIYALPIAGFLIGLAYDRFGQPIKGGNNLVVDTIHDGGPQLPLRMAPMVLFGTVLTHFFGGSAGREGTAVQMGASLADAFAHRLQVSSATRRQLLAAGVAGGFGSVFGTPIAGTIFGLEFVVLGRIEYTALVPALIASLVGDLTTRSLGIGHTHYPSPPSMPLTPLLLGKWLLFSVAVAAASTAFIELTHAIKKFGEKRLRSLPLRMLLGGTVVVIAWKLLGTSDYLGLGVPTIVRAFNDPHLPWYAFAAKLVLTAITVGSGFLGGEVTPLFFVGASLGNLLAQVLQLPLSMGAGVGLAAVFAAASNAPIALSVMAIELLGAQVAPHVVLVSVLAYLLTGHRSIYPAQRLFTAKTGAPLELSGPLRELNEPPPPKKAV